MYKKKCSCGNYFYLCESCISALRHLDLEKYIDMNDLSIIVCEYCDRDNKINKILK